MLRLEPVWRRNQQQKKQKRNQGVSSKWLPCPCTSSQNSVPVKFFSVACVLPFSHYVFICLQCSSWALSSAIHILQQPFFGEPLVKFKWMCTKYKEGRWKAFNCRCLHLSFFVYVLNLCSFLVSSLSVEQDFDVEVLIFMFCQSRNSCILSIFWYFTDFLFPALRVFSFCRFTMKLKVWILKNSQFCKISAFGEFRKTRRSKRIEESSKTRKLRSVKIMCLCGGVCLFRIVMKIFFLFFACLLSPLLPSSLSRSPFSPFPLSSSALFLLLSLLGSLWWGAARYCRRESRRPLAPLALNKENFAVVTSRSMTLNT